MMSIELNRLNERLSALCADPRIRYTYANCVIEEGKIILPFAYEEEETADRLIREVRRSLASFGPEYWFPNYHAAAALFHEHLQYRVRKCFIQSSLSWMVSFILCGPEEGYSLVEECQP